MLLVYFGATAALLGDLTFYCLLHYFLLAVVVVAASALVGARFLRPVLFISIFNCCSGGVEFSMNAAVVAAFQPIAVEKFNWGADQIAQV